MKEISLHILDLVENSINAGSTKVKISIVEKSEEDTMEVLIEDNGRGMNKEFLDKVQDPFTTTRKTRKVGLGIPLSKASALRCEGDFDINSTQNKGTTIFFSYKRSHIDRAPLGNIGETIATLISYNSKIDYIYEHYVDDEVMVFDTREIKKILDGVPIDSIDILVWLKDYINTNIRELYKYKTLL